MSSTVIHLIPPCPPPRIKSATGKVSKTSKVKPIEDEDLDDDYIAPVPKKTTKPKTAKKRNEPVIPVDSEEEEYEEPKPKKTTKKKSQTVSKTKLKKKVVEEEEIDHDQIVPPIPESWDAPVPSEEVVEKPKEEENPSEEVVEKPKEEENPSEEVPKNENEYPQEQQDN